MNVVRVAFAFLLLFVAADLMWFAWRPLLAGEPVLENHLLAVVLAMLLCLVSLKSVSPVLTDSGGE